MPFESKAQQRWAFAGGLPKRKALEWAHETPNMKKLPEHKKTAAKPALFQKLKAQFNKHVMKPKVADMPKLATVLGTVTGPVGTAAIGAAKVGYQGFKTLGKQKPLASPLMKTGSVGVAVAAGFTKGAELKGYGPGVKIVGPGKAAQTTAKTPWHKGINWKHMAAGAGIGAVGGWMLRGRDDN